MNKKPYKYIPIKILGHGSYGKAYLVDCSVDNVNITVT
jgi:hypothetical protein